MSKRTPLPDRPLVFSLARARPARGRPRGADHTRGPWQFLRMQEMMKTAPPPLAKVEDVPLLDVAEADVVAPASSVSEQTNASAFNLRLVYMETAFHYLSLSLWHGVILSQWMYLLSSDTRIVGIAEGLPGIAKLVAAVAAAVVVDACPRNPLLLWSGVGGIAVHALMAGLLPILWATGTGAEVMQRIAVPMIGGMVSSTILTLVVIPAIYAIVHGMRLSRGDASTVD